MNAQTPCRPMYDRVAYNQDMRKSLGSKLFFLPHIPVHVVNQYVDFGCADGSMLKSLGKLSPQAELVGVDNDLYQRSATLANVPNIGYVASSLDKVSVLESGSVLVLSSVLHEIMSAPEAGNTPLDAARYFAHWWAQIEKLGFDYIVIRDFGVSGYLRHLKTPRAWLDAVIGSSLEGEWGRMLQVSERWGLSCSASAYAFTHYLLKRTYVDNWARELDENYLALDRESLISLLTDNGQYRLKHFRGTQTKKFANDCERDLGITVDWGTHSEIVLVRDTGTPRWPAKRHPATAGDAS
ncbi:hypothetical protein M2322_002673 [Rhodoblastus acidophilus]|uniref:class I SAM-dependent methyltransferase n=1 Tax=Rhodoblastus acidophilus TaxID=1074 RepID=UPI002224B1B9|nr:class I SAM-dependent methyltransferase [Rhodoblastus acidophilus]MCW2317119.1 hypothetical protein [Rhodoblastus acidophilus]